MLETLNIVFNYSRWKLELYLIEHNQNRHFIHLFWAHRPYTWACCFWKSTKGPSIMLVHTDYNIDLKKGAALVIWLLVWFSTTGQSAIQLIWSKSKTRLLPPEETRLCLGSIPWYSIQSIPLSSVMILELWPVPTKWSLPWSNSVPAPLFFKSRPSLS